MGRSRVVSYSVSLRVIEGLHASVPRLAQSAFALRAVSRDFDLRLHPTSPIEVTRATVEAYRHGRIAGLVLGASQNPARLFDADDIEAFCGAGLHSPDEAGGDVVPPVGVQVHRVPAVAPHEVRRTRDRRWLTISFRWPASAIDVFAAVVPRGERSEWVQRALEDELRLQRENQRVRLTDETEEAYRRAQIRGFGCGLELRPGDMLDGQHAEDLVYRELCAVVHGAADDNFVGSGRA